VARGNYALALLLSFPRVLIGCLFADVPFRLQRFTARAPSWTNDVQRRSAPPDRLAGWAATARPARQFAGFQENDEEEEVRDRLVADVAGDGFETF
jgi:hypothetical protein